MEGVFLPGALACLALGAGACINQVGGAGPLPERPAAVGGATSSLFGPSTGGAFGSTGGAAGTGFPISGGGRCSLPAATDKPVFAEQVIDTSKLPRRELFSWTTDVQAAALRRDQVLFSQSERPGRGPGYAFSVFGQIAQDTTNPERAQLAGLLGTVFEKPRFAWSEPWATRMGWPGEDYGGNLLRIVLKPEAWLVVVRNGDLNVFDAQNEPVSLTEALAQPERLAAIFYQRDSFAGGPTCSGSFQTGSNGYREFIVGNLAMVEEWSLGTQEIRDRLSASIEQLTAFLGRIRACPITNSAQQWNDEVVCRWDSLDPELTELSAYEHVLAIPSDNYLEVPDRIAAMIETLQGDLFEPDPLVVTPGSP